MERFEHCMVEFYWAVPSGVDPVLFKPAFTVFHSNGQQEAQQGGNPELTALFNKMGQEGWRIATAITASNWILWTLERKLT